MLAVLERIDNEYLRLDKEICEMYLRQDHKVFRENIIARRKRS